MRGSFKGLIPLAQRFLLPTSALLHLAAVALISFAAGLWISSLKDTRASKDFREFFCSDCTCADPVAAEDVRELVLEKLYDGRLPFEDFPPRHVAGLLAKKKHKVWDSRTPVFRRLLEEVRPRVVVELGTFLGTSAIHMAYVADELELKTDFLCVDDFRGWPAFLEKFPFLQHVNGDTTLLHQMMQNVKKENFTHNILPIPFSTSHALQAFCDWGIVADLIEVDAGHDFHSAWSDINKAYPLLRKQTGVMFGHDYFTDSHNYGVQRAVDLFAKEHGLRVETDGAHWIFRKKR